MESSPPDPPDDLGAYLVQPLGRQSVEQLETAQEYIDELLECRIQHQDSPDDVEIEFPNPPEGLLTSIANPLLRQSIDKLEDASVFVEHLIEYKTEPDDKGPTETVPMPSPPENIPGYVVDPLERQSLNKLEDIKDYVEDLIQFRIEQASRFGDDVEFETDGDVEVIDDPDSDGYFVIKPQQCGKDCKKCPHGPYKWKVTPDGKGGENWECVENVGQSN